MKKKPDTETAPGIYSMVSVCKIEKSKGLEKFFNDGFRPIFFVIVHIDLLRHG